MKKQLLLIACFCLSLVSMLSAQVKESYPDVDIAYKSFKLDNGLTLIVHEDHKAPIVAFNVWYHVGSKNEKPGKSGFAHLFEHLMFNGSEHFDDDYFKAMDRIGATDLNGTTNNDRTNYFENIPLSALDLVLWMESDRMGHLIGAISQAKLDEQRGVVQNEKRQGDNQPYAISEELITKATYPVGHPYSWTVIGSMEDLNAASLDDVKDWFKTYYGAANAVICIAGDIDADKALEKVKYYFGDIPSGPPVSKYTSWVAKMEGARHQYAQDRVPQTKLQKVWNIPGWGTEEGTLLQLAANVLSSGKSSRLYKRLVYDEQIATDASAYLDSREIGSQFYIEVDVKPGVDPKKVDSEIEEELAKLLASGPTELELRKIKTQYFAGFLKGMERIGGFGGKSDILAQSTVFGGSPDHYKKVQKWIKDATPAAVQNMAKLWLSDGQYELQIDPFPDYTTTSPMADRSKLPELGETAEAKFPAFEKTTLSNGMKVILSHNTSVPVVRMNMMFDAGYASDQFSMPGISQVSMNLMDEGTKTRSSLQINEDLQLLGGGLGSSSDMDMSYISMSALKNNVDPTLDIYADVILNPSFPQADFDRITKEQLVKIKQEKSEARSMAFRVLPQFIYGKTHPYGNSFTGSGTEESIAKMKRSDVENYYNTWIKPNNATLVVVGDITMDELKAKLEKRFGNWKKGTIPQKSIPDVNMSDKPVVYILDKPGAAQSTIIATQLAPKKNNPDELALTLANNILGGDFTSRINMNLREDKHWSYGSFSFVRDVKGQRPYMAFAPVQTDKTKESIVELNKELNDFITSRPITDEEFKKTQNNSILELSGQWETMNAISASISQMVRFGLEDNYYQTYASKLKNLKTADAVNAVKKVLKPKQMVWLIVGDRNKIEQGIRDLNLGEVKLIDADGNIIYKP